MRHILIILTFFITCAANAQNKDSVTLKGKIVDFETKKASASFVVFYKNSKTDPNYKLSDVEIADSLFIAYANTDTNGDFIIKLLKGDYLMRINSPLSLNITQKISLHDSIIDLGIYDSFSSCYYTDEAPAMTALRQRVYNRILKYRRDGNPTKYNIVKDDEIETVNTTLSVEYSDFESDSDIKAYYSPGTVIFKKDLYSNREETKKKMDKYMIKMEKKYSRLEESSYNELLQKENL